MSNLQLQVASRYPTHGKHMSPVSTHCMLSRWPPSAWAAPCARPFICRGMLYDYLCIQLLGALDPSIRATVRMYGTWLLNMSYKLQSQVANEFATRGLACS